MEGLLKIEWLSFDFFFWFFIVNLEFYGKFLFIFMIMFFLGGEGMCVNLRVLFVIFIVMIIIVFVVSVLMLDELVFYFFSV